jgi:hypothetical protein
MTTFRFRGASAQRYLYSLTPITEALSLPLQAGILIFASGTSLAPTPVYVAAASGLRVALQDLTLWGEARERHDATLLYFRCDLAGTIESREAEAQDIIEGYAPEMNVRIVERDR